MNQELMVTAVILVLLAAAALGIRLVRKAWPVWEENIRTKIGAAQWDMLRSLARTFILAAEQVAERLGLDTGEKKKAFVVDQLLAQAKALGIPVTREQVEMLIEGVLKEIKRETTGLVLGEINQAYNTYG